MKTAKIDILNIGLILLSLALAIALPFRLFLWAYAFLGPLHYLTEINWLNQKKFFVKQKKTVWILIVATVIFILPSFVFGLKIIPESNNWLHSGLMFVWYHTVEILLFSFFISIVFVHVKSIINILILGLLSAGLSIIIVKYNLLGSVGILLPSIIHVYFFTMLFMIYGVIKDKTNWGVLSIIILCLIPFIICYIPVQPIEYVLNKSSESQFNSSGFSILTQTIGGTLSYENAQESSFLYSIVGIRIQMFIAFAYTYHYLNWFSKTTKIGWFKSLSNSTGGIDIIKISLLIIIWIFGSWLYWYDYHLALLVFLLLSYLHVILEFPLNYISIKEIFNAFKKSGK